MGDNRSETFNRMLKTAKRIAIEILISLPVCVEFGYLTKDVITKDFLQILCYIGFMLVAVVVGELIYRYKQKKKLAQQIENPKRDVYK